VALIGVLAACGPQEEKTAPGDDVIAQTLWDHFQGARHWQSPEGWDGLPASTLEAEGEHGAYTEIRMNRLAAGTIGGDVLPGGVLVTADYDEDGETLLQWTAMKKIPGYDPDNDDWFWARYSPEGEVKLKGTLNDCIYCHLNGTDLVYSAWLTPSAALDTGR